MSPRTLARLRATRTRLPLTAALVAMLTAAVPALSLPQGSTFLVSRPDGTGPLAPPITNHSSMADPGGGPTGTPAPQSVSDDGRYVVFVSNADGLVADDVDTVQNVYLRDRQLQTTTLVSRATGVLGAGANGSSFSPSITPNGRYVAFASRATNLSDFDEGGVSHVFLRDTIGGTTQLIDRADGASGVIANQSSASPAVGIVVGLPAVAFVTSSDNLIAETVPANVSQVYMRRDGVTTLVSRRDGQTATNPNAPGNAASSQPDISTDGTRIAFTTAATNLIDAGVPGDDDVNGSDDIYVRTPGTSDTALVSLSEQGAPLNGDSGSPSISADGSHVAFVSVATDVTDFTFADPDGSPDVYVRGGGAIELASRADGAGVKGNAASTGPSISADETRVTFQSNSSNLEAVDTNPAPDVYLRRLDTNITTLLSQSGGAPGDGASLGPAMSGDGEFVAFETDADGFSADDDNDFRQVFTRYIGPLPALFPFAYVSRPSGNGVFRSGVNDAFHVGSARNGTAIVGSSADGRFVVFVSAEDDLSAEDDDRFVNVFVRDTLLNTTILVNRASGAAGAAADGQSGSLEANLGNGIGAPAITPDGTKVVFASAGANLVPGDTNSAFDVFVRDIVAHTTTRVSLRPDGSQIPEGAADPAMDAAGNRIAFVTSAAMDAGDTNGVQADVYLRDVAANTTTLLSRQTGVGVAGNDSSNDPAVSGDGTKVAFVTSASNLAPPIVDGNGLSDVYMRTLATNATSLVSARAQLLLQVGNASSSSPAINADGTRVAFTSGSNNLVGASFDGNSFGDVYLRDFTRPTDSQTVLVSRTNGPNGITGSAESKSPSISADGSRVAFQSSSPELAPGDTTGTVSDVFVRDVTASTTALVGLADGPTGSQPVDGAFSPSISADGDCVSFATASDTLVPGTTGRDFARLYMRAVRGECGAPVPVPPPPPADTTPPTVTALRLTPASFRAGTRILPKTKLRPAIGTNIRFTLNEAGSVRIQVHALLAGKRVKTSCVPPKPGLKGKACTRIVLRGTLTRTGKIGANRVPFTGRIKGKKLAPGRYRISVIATDAAGNASKVVRKVFVVVR